MYFMELNNEAIAGVFGYVDGEIFHWAKTGYNEKFRFLSPSNLLLLFIVENIISNYPKIKIFHMFPWDYNYKHRYTNMNASCYENTFYQPTIRGSLVKFANIFKRKVKALL